MGGYSVTDPTYQALSSSDDDPRAMLRKIISPTSAAELVGPPPDSPPAHQPGQSTPLSGNLAAAPKQAVAKNMDTAVGRTAYNTQSPIGGLTGTSNPPDGGNVRSIVNPQSVQPAQGIRPLQPVRQPLQSAQPMQRPALMNPDPNASLRPGGNGSLPVLPAPATAVNGPTQLDLAQSKLNTLTNNGPGWQQIKNPVGRVAAGIGNGILSFLDPRDAANINGTTGHNQQLIQRQQGVVGNLQGQQQATAALADTQSQAAEREAQGRKADALAQSDAPITLTPEQASGVDHPELAGLPMAPRTFSAMQVAHTRAGAQKEVGADNEDARQAALGMKPATDANGKKTYAPDQDSPVYQLKKSQTELDNAKADAANADPGTPAGRMAIAKLREAEAGHSAAMVRAQASMINAQAGAFGTYGGKALPGAMLTDHGQPVGSHFAANVRPTGQERGKADMAASAEEQLTDIKSIIQKHPTLFGPGYGQASAFRQWLGSQDPDAQRFIAARTIAGDHLAGTFGGRSETALHALDNAIGQFKDNPKAALAGIDQLTRANTRFKQAGTVKTVGSNAASAPAPSAAPSGRAVSLADARGLKQNKGKSDAEITKDIESHGHKVIP